MRLLPKPEHLNLIVFGRSVGVGIRRVPLIERPLQDHAAEHRARGSKIRAVLEHLLDFPLQELMAVLGAMGKVAILHPQGRIGRTRSPGQFRLVQHENVPGGISARIPQLAGEVLKTKAPEIPKVLHAGIIQKCRRFQGCGLGVPLQNR